MVEISISEAARLAQALREDADRASEDCNRLGDADPERLEQLNQRVRDLWRRAAELEQS